MSSREPIDVAEQTPAFRPLYFIAAYPYSGGERVRGVTFAAAVLGQANPPEKLDFTRIDNVLPWDIHEELYRMATGKDPKAMSEPEIAAARLEVHRLLAEKFPGLPVVRTQAMRASYHGHRTINGDVSRGATYIVRNPIDIALAISQMGRLEPIKAIAVMVQRARRARPHARAVLEPIGSWSENVDSWTAGTDRNIHVVRYEDLVSRPSRTYEDIFRHMRLNVSGPLLDKAIRSISGVRGEVSGLPMTHFKPLEVRALVEVMARGMDRHGYLTDAVLDYARISREDALAQSDRHNEGVMPATTSAAPAAAND